MGRRSELFGRPRKAVLVLLAGVVPAAIAATAVVASAGTTAPAVAAPAAWSVPLAPTASKANGTSAGVEDANAAYNQGALSVRDVTVKDRSGRGFAVRTSGVYSLDIPSTGFTAKLTANIPPGSDVSVELRGQGTDSKWTEWRDITTAGTRFATEVPRVQARISLWANPNTGRTPAVSAVVIQPATGNSLAGNRVAAAAAATPLTYRIFGTREGLVGHTTANGHVIKSRDHFVALPSRRGLSPKNSSQYSVRVCNPANGRCETAPVWDVGPWNTKDDYWNPSSTREMFKDLPQGRPEAQAAYQDGYNGGKDASGRKVANPAGIDLADGTFWDGLGMSNNGWVNVTFLWTSGGGGGGTPTPTWPTLRSGSTGEDVKTVQYLLNQRGASLTVDGNFGSLTAAAVRSFQSANGLSADGVVGSLTWPKLVMTVQQNSSGQAVRAVQSQLNTRGFGLTVDGNFGALTNTAVRSFQSSRGIGVDGVVGPTTWLHLAGG